MLNPHKSPLLTSFLCKLHINKLTNNNVRTDFKWWDSHDSHDLVENLIKSNWADDSSHSLHSQFPCTAGGRPLQAPPNVTPKMSRNILLTFVHIWSKIYSWTAIFSKALTDHAKHIKLACFSSGPLCSLSTECENMQRCSTLGYLGTHFIPITPGESPSTVNLERGGNPSWQSISFLRHAGVRSTLNSLHRANWITHDCRSISRRHASIPICWGRWICVEINRDWKGNRSNDHRNTGCFRWGSAWKTAYVAVAPLPLCTWRQHRAFWAGYLTLKRS